MGFRSWFGIGQQVRSAGGAALLAAAVLFGGMPQSVPMAAADSVGEIVVKPAGNKTVNDVNRLFGTSTKLVFTDAQGQALVASSAVQTTLAKMQADASSATPTIAWAEANTRADDPRVQDDSGADPFCPAPPADVPTEAAGQDDSGADQRCTRVILLRGLLNFTLGIGSMYGIERTQLDDAQKVREVRQGRGQVVAILDTQVDVTHTAFLLHTRLGLDLLGASLLTALPTKGHARGHGTFVAGLVMKAAPESIILPVRVLNEDGRGSTAQVAEGIRWAVNHGADVINMSLSTPTDTRVMREAVEYALSKNVTLVAAYGNEGKNQPAVYPADYKGVISVMATDKNDRRASFSNYGRAGLVAAPGVNIISAYPTLMYAIGSGTSYASPLVAGEAALILQASPNATPAQVLNIIQQSSDDVSAANNGAKTVRINALKAVNSIR